MFFPSETKIRFEVYQVDFSQQSSLAEKQGLLRINKDKVKVRPPVPCCVSSLKAEHVRHDFLQ